MRERLLGQSIGSIRRVRFVPEAAAAPSPARHVAIEIETKAGRFFHWVTDAHGARVRLRAGAAVPADPTAPLRQWQDLTDEVPAAFDGRPTITAVSPIAPDPTDGGDPVARAWRISLSTGAALECGGSAEGPVLGLVRELLPGNSP